MQQKNQIKKKAFLFYPFYLLLTVLVILMTFTGCSSTSSAKKTVPVKPAWLENRPVNNQYYFGIGSAIKKGSIERYRNEARDKALSEMAGQINTMISSNAVLYKVEDRFGVREMLQNRIKAESNEFLDGYEFMDQWEDETRFYTIYRLSKPLFEKNKELRKKVAADGAYLKYQQAVNHLHGNNFILAFTLFAQTLENIKDYLQEGVVITTQQGFQIDLGGSSLNYLAEILNNLRISPSKTSIIITGEEPNEKLFFTVSDNKNNPVPDIPVKLNYSGGYLTTDNGKSDRNGVVDCPLFKAPAHNSRETISASIDVQALARTASFDLDIRRMIEKWNSATCKVQLEFVR